MKGLEVFDLALERDHPVGERLGRPGVFGHLLLVAPLLGVVGHHHGLACIVGDLLVLLHGAVESDLGLLLIGDHVRSLFLQAPVLLVCLGDGLLELDLGIGPLVETAGESRRRVLPPTLDELEHAGDGNRHEAVTQDRWPEPHRTRCGEPVRSAPWSQTLESQETDVDADPGQTDEDSVEGGPEREQDLEQPQGGCGPGRGRRDGKDEAR